MADADDLAQESLVKAYMAIDRYKDSGQFKSWLFRIAHNTFLNHVAAQKEYEDLDRVQAECDSDAAFMDKQRLYAALATLPPKERSALCLYYLNSYSIKEIASIMECSEDAVKKQLSRGREKLKVRINL